MLSFLNQYAKNYRYSQNGEEGVVLECWRRLSGIDRPISAEIAPQDGTLPLWMTETGKAVEIGGNNGLYCSNAALLAEHGWETLFVEDDYSLHKECVKNWSGRSHVRSQCSYVDGKNINAFVDDSCDLLSLDTDGSDYAIFAGLEARPKIVIMEIDSSIPPNDPSFNADGAAGYYRGVELGLEKDYHLLCHTGNLIFIRADFKPLFPEIKGRHPLIESEYYFNRAWLKEEAA